MIVEHDGLRFYLFGRKDFEELTNQKYIYPSGINGTFELPQDDEASGEADEE